MTFKKKKLLETKLQKKYIKTIKKNRLFGLFFGIITISIIISIGNFSLKYVSDFNFNLPIKAIDITTDGKKDTLNINNKTKDLNILLLGHGGGNHEAPMLTDTIILAKINFEQKNISMLSIPRDFYVQYNDEKSYKINEIYMRKFYETNSKEKAAEKLMKKITQITGEKVDKYINIDFNGFKKIIDSIGGIKITLDKTFVDNRYPDGNRGYTTFILKKGTWVIDGNVALKYARSRHSTSDFDRSLRQQKIINAVKEKILSLGFLSSPSKIKNLYTTINDNIDTNLSTSEIINLLIFSKDIKQTDLYTSNLNDSCYYGSDQCNKGGFLYLPLRSDFNNQSVLLSYGNDKDNLNNYSEIQKYTDIIFNYTELYKENYQINIYNSTKLGGVATNFAEYLKRYGFNIPQYNSVGNARDKIYNKTTVYYNGINDDSITLKVLKKFIFGPFVKIEKAKYSNDINTRIEIIIGEDYKYLNY